MRHYQHQVDVERATYALHVFDRHVDIDVLVRVPNAEELPEGTVIPNRPKDFIFCIDVYPAERNEVPKEAVQEDPILENQLDDAITHGDTKALAKLAGIVLTRWKEAVAAYQYMKKNFYEIHLETERQEDVKRLVNVIDAGLRFAEERAPEPPSPGE